MENSTVGVNGVIKYHKTYATSTYHWHEIILEVHGCVSDKWHNRVWLHHDYPVEFYTVNERFFEHNVLMTGTLEMAIYVEYDTMESLLAAVERYKQGA